MDAHVGIALMVEANVCILLYVSSLRLGAVRHMWELRMLLGLHCSLT